MSAQREILYVLLEKKIANKLSMLFLKFHMVKDNLHLGHLGSKKLVIYKECLIKAFCDMV